MPPCTNQITNKGSMFRCTRHIDFINFFCANWGLVDKTWFGQVYIFYTFCELSQMILQNNYLTYNSLKRFRRLITGLVSWQNLVQGLTKSQKKITIVTHGKPQPSVLLATFPENRAWPKPNLLALLVLYNYLHILGTQLLLKDTFLNPLLPGTYVLFLMPQCFRKATILLAWRHLWMVIWWIKKEGIYFFIKIFFLKLETKCIWAILIFYCFMARPKNHFRHIQHKKLNCNSFARTMKSCFVFFLQCLFILLFLFCYVLLRGISRWPKKAGRALNPKWF